MNEWQVVFGFLFAVLGVLLCIIGIFIRLHRTTLLQDKANCCLCIGVFAMIWHLFIYCLIYTGKIVDYPYLYNKGIPLYYIIAPCFYFYAQFTLSPSTRLPRYWYLHLMPFLFGIIDVLPYAFASVTDQKHLLQSVAADLQTGFKHSYGFIDQKWHYVIRFSLAIIYAIAQWRLLYIFDDHEEKHRMRRKKKTIIFTTVYSGYLLFQCSLVLAIMINQQQGSFILRNIDNLILISFFFFLFSVWFIISSFQVVHSAENLKSQDDL